MNAQNWHFGIITDEEIKQQLVPLTGGQEFIAAAPVIIALCATFDTDIPERSADDIMAAALRARVAGGLAGRRAVPRVLIIGAKGRVGTGAGDLCTSLGVAVNRWDMAETASGGPFPEVLQHDIFFNCILARPGTPVFVPANAKIAQRTLSVIGDIACDPDSDYNPVPLYDAPTNWAQPVVRVCDAPPLDVMAIDNLPSLLPLESSLDYAEQLLPTLMTLQDPDAGVWRRAHEAFRKHAN